MTLDSELFRLLFSSLHLITHFLFSPPLPAVQPAVPLHLLQVRSDQPMTPCWDMWHFCHYTSHLPKLACIILSHEQLNYVGRWQCMLGGKAINKDADWNRVTEWGRCCQARLEGLLRSSCRRLVRQKEEKRRLEGFTNKCTTENREKRNSEDYIQAMLTII